MKRIRARLGLKGFEGVDSNGMSGGLALYWHESCVVEVVDKEERYIDALVRMQSVEPNGELLVCMENLALKIVISCGRSFRV